MCGIAGWFGNSGGLQADGLVAALRHRGPDGAGVWRSERATLVHTRLAILELSDAGKQPMVCERPEAGNLKPEGEEPGMSQRAGGGDSSKTAIEDSGSPVSVICFNGEIYNHAELREELEEVGETFVGHSDTEVLLRLLVREGEACLPKLAGMFAFAFWDEARGEALLARDPFGIKPLYYRIDDGVLAFASEARVLRRDGDEIDADALRDFFLWGSVPEPATVWRGIRQVPAGHLLRWREGEVVVEKWYGGQMQEVRTQNPERESSEAAFVASSSKHLRSSAFICGSTSSTLPFTPQPNCGSDGMEEGILGARRSKDGLERDAPATSPDTSNSSQLSNLRKSESICSSNSSSSIAKTRAALEECMRRHLVADVPVGVFLSGGIDSTAILALARQALGADADIRTFSIGFDDPAFDESGLARRTAEHFGARHTEWRMTPEEGAAEIPAYLTAVDQPTIDGFNTWCVSKLSAREGMKVVLSGLGGDEIFAGYGSFDRVPKLYAWHRRLGPLRPLAAKLLETRPAGTPWRRLAAYFRGPGTFLAAYHAQRGIFTADEAAKLAESLTGKRPLTVAFSDPYSADSRLLTPASRFLSPDSRLPSSAPRAHVSHLEITRYMRNQLLRDSDVFSMAHGLELRVPLVDARFLNTMQSIPPEIRLRQGKLLFLEAVPEIPEWVRNQPKRGFRFPFQQWMEGQFGELLDEARKTSPIPLNAWYRTWAVAVAMRNLKERRNVDDDAW